MPVQRNINAVSPLDGRYAGKLGSLGSAFGEGALARSRALVECRYLQKLCSTPGVNVRRLKPSEKAFLEKLSVLSDRDVREIVAIEETGSGRVPPTKHDVKAVEYFLKVKMRRSSLRDITEFVHFALTSEDVNNISYALMLRNCLSSEIIPALKEILASLRALAVRHASAPLLARTHGQPAVPTTFGKEFRVFHARLDRQVRQLRNTRICAKLNGASGNYNAHTAAFPRADWPRFSKEFVESFNSGSGPSLEYNPFTNQIEPHDSYAELFDNLRRTNTILLAFCQDMWRYISAGLVKQKAVAGEVGSSTMPQKVNPIHFENAEGNLGLANALLGFFSSKLPVSRLQRDLSDSTVERNFGVALGHGLAAYKSVLTGLARAAVDQGAAREELERHPEVLAEGIQTILRREGETGPYELLSRFTRGREITAAGLLGFIEGLKLKPAIKAELRRLSPLNYTGLSEKLAKQK
ncbi:MAG: adenylosuccinate lyase [Elusimicrobia bacterium CG_4_10_14_0_2_um_filter_56_8]|nr:MAG: adenylosuccinate lyase [Elusimicrobia bacterium CG1_02_56_21]PJA13187.1 MAG: adenylosuccinate lyase [Elusimicrobia bacterium CG_4_10_14_0_2_um_filter_56_8]